MLEDKTLHNLNFDSFSFRRLLTPRHMARASTVIFILMQRRQNYSLLWKNTFWCMCTLILKSQQNYLAEILGFNCSFYLTFMSNKKGGDLYLNCTDVFTCTRQLLEGLIFLSSHRNVKRRKTSFSTLWTPKTKLLYQPQGLKGISFTYQALIAQNRTLALINIQTAVIPSQSSRLICKSLFSWVFTGILDC